MHARHVNAVPSVAKPLSRGRVTHIHCPSKRDREIWAQLEHRHVVVRRRDRKTTEHGAVHLRGVGEAKEWHRGVERPLDFKAHGDCECRLMTVSKFIVAHGNERFRVAEDKPVGFSVLNVPIHNELLEMLWEGDAVLLAQVLFDLDNCLMYERTAITLGVELHGENIRWIVLMWLGTHPPATKRIPPTSTHTMMHELCVIIVIIVPFTIFFSCNGIEGKRVDALGKDVVAVQCHLFRVVEDTEIVTVLNAVFSIKGLASWLVATAELLVASTATERGWLAELLNLVATGTAELLVASTATERGWLAELPNLVATGN
eukprot:PhM_4_TR17906/c0_g2_i1/m.64753